jgi:hypothetical protein
MIRFKKIRYKNFLSVGENPVELNLDRRTKTLVIGKNGHGKCLRATTKIDVDFKDKATEAAFLSWKSKNN